MVMYVVKKTQAILIFIIRIGNHVEGIETIGSGHSTSNSVLMLNDPASR